jgi:hypothetical protein
LSAVLTKLRRVSKRRASAEEEWRSAVLEAHAAGIPLRTIGEAAGVSHVQVLRIVRAT